jgi:hypothetical protein
MRCAAITKAGKRCRLVATHGSYCYSHSPQTAEKRKRSASKGGRAGGNGRGGQSEISDLKAQLEDLAADVLSGEVGRSEAVAINQILNTRARLIELERKVREQEELTERLEALEEVLESRKGGRLYGA